MAGDGNNLTTLSDGMKALKDANLVLTTQGEKDFITAIGELRTQVTETLGLIDPIKHIKPEVGNLHSAAQTKANLDSAVDGTGGIIEVLNGYLTYLDDLETTVKATCDRLIQSG